MGSQTGAMNVDKVILGSFSHRDVDNENQENESVSMEIEKETYSPSDFINHSSTEELGGYHSDQDGVTYTGLPSTIQQGEHLSLSHGIMYPVPLDLSMYRTSSYMDRLPTNLVVTTMAHNILSSQLTGNINVSMSSRKFEQPTRRLSESPGSSSSNSCETQTSSGPLHCRWLDCDGQFSTIDDLVTHVNEHHVRVERPDVEYQSKWGDCPRKGKGFNARYKMLIHVRTHTNEKPHKCSLCDKSFSRLENLKIHRRSHTGEKPYVCPFEGCKKAYSNSSDRFKHVRTHQEDKPYMCKMPGCYKRYTDPSSLRKHVRTRGHHTTIQ